MFGYYSAADVQLPVRRRFLQQTGLGFGSVALASLLHEESRGQDGGVASGIPSAVPVDPLALRPPHFPGRVRSKIGRAHV